jgi:hypothetical protein
MLNKFQGDSLAPEPLTITMPEPFLKEGEDGVHVCMLLVVDCVSQFNVGESKVSGTGLTFHPPPSGKPSKAAAKQQPGARFRNSSNLIRYTS